MNDLNLEKLISSLKKDGINKNENYHRTIALAFWNQLDQNDRIEIAKELNKLKLGE